MFDVVLAGWLDNPETAGMLIFFGICIGVPMIAHYWYKLEKHKADNQLKRSMIERGMSVEEIERVLAATSPKDKDDE